MRSTDSACLLVPSFLPPPASGVLRSRCPAAPTAARSLLGFLEPGAFEGVGGAGPEHGRVGTGKYCRAAPVPALAAGERNVGPVLWLLGRSRAKFLSSGGDRVRIARVIYLHCVLSGFLVISAVTASFSENLGINTL